MFIENWADMHIKEIFGKTFFILAISTVIGFILLCCAYLIPNKLVKNSREDLKSVMDDESPEWIDKKFFTYAYGCKNMPDTFVYRLSYLDENDSLIKRVVGADDEGDNRYWDGFMVIIRPLMIFFSYGQIRYIFVFVDCILIWYTILQLNKKLPYYVSLSFVIGLVMINMIVNFYGVMLNMLFLVMFVFMAYLARNYINNMNFDKLYYIFLLDGILTTYLDRYTASLLTIEMPLLIVVLINIFDRNNYSLKKTIKNILSAGIGWGLGFSLFWFNKWVIASVILKRNVLFSAFHQAAGRATTNANDTEAEKVENTGGRLFTLAKNMMALVPTHGENIVTIVVLCVLIILMACMIWIKSKGKFMDIQKMIPLLIIMIMPYVYYFVLSNLNQIHATFYMYRMQLPTIVSALIIYFYGVKGAEYR